jgi:hypothetical protein
MDRKGGGGGGGNRNRTDLLAAGRQKVLNPASSLLFLMIFF